MFSGPLQMSKWDLGSRRELSETSCRLQGTSSRGHWMSDYWFLKEPSLAFFVVPSFTFILTFWVVLLKSFGQSLTGWSGLLHPKTLWFLLAKWMIYPTDWSAPPTPLEISMSSLAEDSASSSPSGFMPGSSSTSLLFTIADWAVNVWLPFSFQEGSKFPSVWEWVTLILLLWWSLGVEDLWILPIFPPSGLLGAGQSSCWGIHHPLCGPACTSIWG